MSFAIKAALANYKIVMPVAIQNPMYKARLRPILIRYPPTTGVVRIKANGYNAIRIPMERLLQPGWFVSTK